MSWLIKLLNSRLANIFCFLFAVCNRLVFTSLYSSIGRDTMVQLTYAENLAAGKGLGVTKYFTTDLNTPVFDTHQLFPPGYSLTIIPFLKLFSNDLYKAVFAFDLLTSLLFIFSIRYVGKKAGLPLAYLNIVTIIAGCSQYPFFIIGSPTDTIGLTLLLFSLGKLIQILDKKENLNLLQILWIGFLFFLPSFYRYMYMPVVLLFPGIIYLSGLYIKNKNLRSVGIKSGVTSTFLLLILLLAGRLYNGNAVHINNTGHGIFPEQLIHWYPFIPASFINLDFAAQLTSRITCIDYSQAMFLFEVLNPILFFFSLFMLFKFFYKKREVKKISSPLMFLITGFVLTITVLTMLFYLSLTNKAEDMGKYLWTFVYDIRYYAFIYCFTPIAIFIFKVYYPEFFKKSFLKILWFTGLLLFFTEVSHGIYYNIKIIAGKQDLDIIRNRDKDYKSFTGILSSLKNEYPDREIIVSSPDQHYLHKASLVGYKAVFDFQNLNKVDLKVTQKSILLLPVFWQDDEFMKEYVERKKPMVFREIVGTHFYIEEINP